MRFATRERLRGAVLVGACVALATLVVLGITNAPHIAVGDWREAQGYQRISIRSDGSASYNGKSCFWSATQTGTTIKCGERYYKMRTAANRAMLSAVGKDIEFVRAGIQVARSY